MNTHTTVVYGYAHDHQGARNDDEAWMLALQQAARAADPGRGEREAANYAAMVWSWLAERLAAGDPARRRLIAKASEGTGLDRAEAATVVRTLITKHGPAAAAERLPHFALAYGEDISRKGVATILGRLCSVFDPTAVAEPMQRPRLAGALARTATAGPAREQAPTLVEEIPRNGPSRRRRRRQ